MALLWVDGFDKYGTVNGAVSPSGVVGWKYKGYFADQADIVPGRHGGSALRIDNISTYIETPDVATENRTLIVGFAFNLQTITAGDYLVDLRHPQGDGETVGYGQFTVRVQAADLYITRGNTTLNSTTNGSNSGFLSVNTWYYLEMKVYCNTSGGTCNLYIDGVDSLSYSGNTQHKTDLGVSNYSRVLFRKTKTGELWIDDFYIADGSGSGVTDVLGGSDTRVETLSPVSDASGNWTPNTGSDLYAVIDEDDMDANYISDVTTGNQAIFEMTNLSSNAGSGTVQGMMLSCDAQQTSNCIKYPKALTQNGTGTIQDQGSFAPGRDNPLCGTTLIMETDPDGNAWSASTVNTFRLGVEVS